MNVKIVNPIDDRDWDQRISSDDDVSIFHTRAWANVLASSYGYKPLYFVITENSHIRGFIPVMEVSSLLTGKRGVGLPFTDMCVPIAGSRQDFDLILDAIIEYGKASSWKYFELRGGKYLSDEIASETYLEHKIDLKKNFEEIEKAIRKSFKRNIRKAIRNDVQIEITRSKNAFQSFIDLHFMTRKRHGLPPQPRMFFNNLYDQCILEKGHVFLAHYNGEVVASAVFMTHHKHSIYKYGASDFNFQNLRPNNLIFYEAIKFFKEKGFHCLSLGRSDLKNTGLINFKNGLTQEADFIHYNRYHFTRKRFISVDTNYDLMNKLFNRMPLSVLTLTGKLLYKHLG